VVYGVFKFESIDQAAAAGMSRSAFALWFTELLGQTPLEYVTDWRANLTCKTDILGSCADEDYSDEEGKVGKGEGG